MEADLGHNPSFVWRSLLKTKDLIWVAIVWKVGEEGVSRLMTIGSYHTPHNSDLMQVKI